MPKRKQEDNEKQVKRSRTSSEGQDSGEKVTTTKQTKRRDKDNISWPDSDLLEFIKKIEENIPKDDYVSYVCRLEKINWENLCFKTYTVKQCQEIWSLLQKQVRKFRLLREISADIKDWIKSSKRNQPKDTRHPDKPKQPRNSYMLFLDDKRQEVVSDNPFMAPVDVSRTLGQLFKSLPPREKDKYERKAKIARQQYEEKLAHFYEQHPELAPKRPNRRSRSFQIEDGPPDKPKTPFELFLKSELEKEETEPPKLAFNQKCRELWHEMCDQDKLAWINRAEEQNNKYVEDLKKYLEAHPDFEPEKTKPLLTKKEIEIKERGSGKPQKPPHGPYNLFSKMMMQSEEVQVMHSRDSINYISEKWRSCTEAEKNEYKTRVEQMWQEYHKKLHEYLMTLSPEKRDEVYDKEACKKYQVEASIEKTPKRAPVKLKRPERPPVTDYKYFLSCYKGKENPAVAWENLTKEERQVYEEERELKSQTYITLYENYLQSLSKEELLEQFNDHHDTSSESESSNSEDEDDS